MAHMIDIGAEFQPLIGLHAWQVSHGYGSFVTMEFGNPQLEVHKSMLMRSSLEGLPNQIERRFVEPCGQWHLWIYCCDWSITLKGVQVAHDESDDDTVDRSLKILNGQILTTVSVTGVAETQFEFDLGAVLTTRPSSPECYGGEAVEQWFLYKPNEQVLSLRSDGCVSLGPDNRGPDDKEWFPRTPNPKNSDFETGS